MDNQNIITRSIYKTPRISLEVFMYTPNMMQQEKTYTLNYNPILNLKYINPNSLTEDYKKMSYKITPKNLYRTVKFFNTIVKWFYDPEKIALFLKDDDDNPVFNSDFKDLRETTGRGHHEECIMIAIPAVIEFENKKYEGIYLYINSYDNAIPLIFKEVETIFGILKNFNFQQEVSADLMAFIFAKSMGAIEDKQTYIMNRHGYSSMSTKKSGFDTPKST